MKNNLMFVPVEAHCCVLSSGIVLVYSLYGNRVFVTIALVVAGKLFLPVNCLYNFELVV